VCSSDLGAPAASSTSEGTNADATTTTIPAAIDPDGGDAPAANDNQPVEDEPVQVEMGMAEELPEAANDNSPADPLPATGTDG